MTIDQLPLAGVDQVTPPKRRVIDVRIRRLRQLVSRSHEVGLLGFGEITELVYLLHSIADDRESVLLREDLETLLSKREKRHLQKGSLMLSHSDLVKLVIDNIYSALPTMWSEDRISNVDSAVIADAIKEVHDTLDPIQSEPNEYGSYRHKIETLLRDYPKFARLIYGGR
jgi:hypothetical protein